MNIESLSKVQDLTDKLKAATSRHKSFMALTELNGGNFGMNSRAFISLGGDHYGNGTLHKLDITIRHSPEMVRECRKLQSKAWGVVAAIRVELRELGVILEGDK